MARYKDKLTGQIVEAFYWTAGPDQQEDPEWFADQVSAGEIVIENSETPDVCLLSRGKKIPVDTWLLKHSKGGVVPVRRQVFEIEFEAIA